MQCSLILLGDSHTRTYRDCVSFDACIFLGRGNLNNFSTRPSFVLYVVKIIALLVRGVFRANKVGLVLGEPDCRLVALDDDKLGFQRLDLAIKRIGCLISLLGLLRIDIGLIIGAGSPNQLCAGVIRNFNAKLSVLCSRANILFFDPQDKYETAASPDEFIGVKYNDASVVDHVHFSVHMGQMLDEFIRDSGWVAAVRDERSTNLARLGLGYDARFGVWLPNYGLTIRIADKAIVFLLKQFKCGYFREQI